MKYSKHQIIELLEMYNITVKDLADILGIQKGRVVAYLFGDSKKLPMEDAAAIEAAIKVLNSAYWVRPQGKHEDCCADVLKKMVKEEKDRGAEETERAADEIMIILGFDNFGDFGRSFQPLTDIGGLGRYGAEETIARIARKVGDLFEL